MQMLITHDLELCSNEISFHSEEEGGHAGPCLIRIDLKAKKIYDGAFLVVESDKLPRNLKQAVI